MFELFSGGSLTDEGLRHLECLRCLSVLNIKGEDDISDKALGELERKMPFLDQIMIRRNEQKKNRSN